MGADKNRDCSASTLAQEPRQGQPESQPLSLCWQCQMSPSALLLVQITGVHRNVGGAAGSKFLEAFFALGSVLVP